jgi:DNA-binding NarL/FixJ family response regulator
VANILLVSDADSVLADLKAVLDDGENVIREVREGPAVRAAVRELRPDLVVSDLQVGAMGGVAICYDLRLEESGGRLGYVPVLLLLDRRADVFIARQAGAEGFLIKPLDPVRLRRATRALLSDETFYDESYRPAEIGEVSGVGG